MKVHIIIPTLKSYDDVVPMLKEIDLNTEEEYRATATCIPQSAAKNRNQAHSKVCEDIVISLDDDMTGFYKGWVTDLVTPLIEDENIKITSARLLKPKGDGTTTYKVGVVDGEPAFMMSSNLDMSGDYEYVEKIPTACFAYRKRDIDAMAGFFNPDSVPFDVNFLGAGWEDTAFCHDLKLKYPEAKLVIVNKCRLIHINEAKNNHEYFHENKAYYTKSGRT